MVYQLKITLKNVSKPPVWRRILVPSAMTFHQLHLTIQEAMGWENRHLYQFGYKVYDGISISEPCDNGWDRPDFNSHTTLLFQFLNEQRHKMVYTYDFGDDWIHDVVIEKILNDKDIEESLPTCISAKGVCPPEDCGGPWGYEELKEICANPVHDEWQFMRLMHAGMDPEDCDFTTVDIDDINSRLRELTSHKARRRAINNDKVAERVKLLNRLTQEYLAELGCPEGDVNACSNLIISLAESPYNISLGSPEIWAAALVQVITKNSLLKNNGTQITREKICEHFGVKQASVNGRITQIHNVLEDCAEELRSNPKVSSIYNALEDTMFDLIEKGHTPQEAFQIILDKLSNATNRPSE